METQRAGNTRVFIVEDSAPIRSRLIEMIGQVERADVVGEADTAAEAIDSIRKLHPDLVVLDFRLLQGTAVDVLRALGREPGHPSFIVLTNHPSPQYRDICFANGAAWFFDKSTDFEKVRDVVESFGRTTS
ncbi:MAG TPA: response regulator transcription factor [Burkholderiaceae bacterium]|jgi:two-component system, NarL family, response regulator DevR|nr:response regulator transcription factor [Burkholderiaceae bacterium]